MSKNDYIAIIKGYKIEALSHSISVDELKVLERKQEVLIKSMNNERNSEEIEKALRETYTNNEQILNKVKKSVSARNRTSVIL